MYSVSITINGFVMTRKCVTLSTATALYNMIKVDGSQITHASLYDGDTLIEAK